MSPVVTRGPSIRDVPPEFPKAVLPPVDPARLETFCLFIGYPRSGHTVIGSLLDAHPEIVIANELDVLKFVRPGVGPGPGVETPREMIFAMLLDSARLYAEGGCKMRGYSYAVPGQWQGRCRDLRVIGDKRGGVTARRLSLEPELLQRLRDCVQLPVKFIHVYRNPFDNIATMSRREAVGIVNAVNMYFELAGHVQQARELASADRVLDMSHESFIRDPRGRLRELCAFLGRDAADDYLEACARIVFESPHPTRENVAWQQREIDAIRGAMEKYPFLHEYLEQPPPIETRASPAARGKEGTVEARWPAGEGPAVLVALSARQRDFESVLQALKRLGARVLVQCPNLPEGLLKKFRSERMRFSEKPIELDSALRGADLFICQADQKAITIGLNAGVPQLLLSMGAKQGTLARRVAKAGFGEAVEISAFFMPPIYDELIPAMLKEAGRYREAARAWKGKVGGTEGDAARESASNRPESAGE